MAAKSVVLDPAEAPAIRRALQARDRRQNRVLIGLYETVSGADWWLVKGANMRKAVFDLKDGSRSLAVFEAYRAGKAAKATTNSHPIANDFLPLDDEYTPDPTNEDDEPPPPDRVEEIGEVDADVFTPDTAADGIRRNTIYERALSYVIHAALRTSLGIRK